MTQTGMSLGTPAYMSPEQAMGERDIGARCDVYALGAMTYEMLTGEPPFTGPNSQAIVAKVLTETAAPAPPQAPHGASAAVEHAVLVALQKLPADRYGSAKEFADALDAARAGATPQRLRPRPPAFPALPAFPAWRRLPPPHCISAAATWGCPAARASGAPSGIAGSTSSLGDGPASPDRLPGLALSPDADQSGLRWGAAALRAVAETPPPTPGHADHRHRRRHLPDLLPDGAWIAFIADGRLKKIRPDGGAPITLSDSAFATFGGAAWLDDGTLVYVGPSAPNVSRVSEAGGAVTTGAQPTRRSRDWARLAHAAARRARRAVHRVQLGLVTMALRVLDLRTGQYHKLLDRRGDRLVPAHRPAAVLCAATEPRSWRRSISIASTSTGPRHAMRWKASICPTARPTYLAWSPTGTLVYLQGGGNANDQMSCGERDGRVNRWTGRHGGFNSFEPFARRLADRDRCGTRERHAAVWIKQLTAARFTRLTFGGQDRRPAWSPDGQLGRIHLGHAGGSTGYALAAPMAVPTRSQLLARFDQAVQEVDLVTRRPYWTVVRFGNGGTSGNRRPVPAAARRDTVPGPCSRDEFEEFAPAVSPDGRWFAYASNESGRNEVYRAPASGDARRRQGQVSVEWR